MNERESSEHRVEREITFTKDRREVLLDVAKEQTGLALVEEFASSHLLIPKHEFHVTLVGGAASKMIVEVLDALPDSERQEMEERITALASSIDWQPVFTDIFYYLRREYNDPDPLDPEKAIPEIRETIIQLADVPRLVEFQHSLKALLGIEGEMAALPHVTIYSNSTREDKKLRGIGVYSEEDLRTSNAERIML